MTKKTYLCSEKVYALGDGSGGSIQGSSETILDVSRVPASFLADTIDVGVPYRLLLPISWSARRRNRLRPIAGGIEVRWNP